MKSFLRSFEYVWPQWPRLIVAVLGAMVVGILFAFSIATVMPLLKVMMGEEGLHGWADRKICEHRYGLSFYVPERFELTDPNNLEIAYSLQIAGVDQDSAAGKAELMRGDAIVGVADLLIDGQTATVPSSRLLSRLAGARKNEQINIQFQRIGGDEGLVTEMKTINAGPRPFYFNYVRNLLRVIPDGQDRQSKRKAVIFIILMMMVVTMIRCLARYFQTYTVHKIMHTSLANMRADAFSHSLEIPAGFFDQQGASDTVSRLIGDTTTVGIGIKILLGKTLREPLKAIAMLSVAVWIEPKLTLIFACGAPMSLYAINQFGRKIKRATKKSLINWAQMLGKLKEALGLVKVVKVYNQQGYERSRFEAINRSLLKQQLKISKVESSTGPLMETLGMVAGSVGLIFGAQWVYQGQMMASEFFTLLTLLGATAESIRKTSDVWNKFQQANAASERVYGVMDRPGEVEDADAVELAPLRDEIIFQDIVFSYPGAERPVLKGINLTVKAGHNVAIVGPNGSGKTTLANLIPRLYNPDSGRILIDQADIGKAGLHSLRSQIGMVTQNISTFNDTIAANIAYGRPEATREEIIAAAKRAFAHEFIEPLPDGYDSFIGEQGAGLSGGQLQRIVIARAILKNPAILIFDEATSQVDADSEAKIHKAIEEIMRDRTSFIIAHRFSTVISADVIVVMDDGGIVAQGPHKELIKSCPLYRSLYDTQLVKG